MMASYESQLKFKVKRLLHALKKRGIALDEGVLKEIVSSPEEVGYRNRVQLKTDGIKLGYVSENSSFFAPIEDCIIMNPELRDLFLRLKQRLPHNSWEPAPGYTWNFIDLDNDMTVDDVVINRRRPFRQGNSFQNEVMKKWVEHAFQKLPRHFPIIDLFCGSGNFTEVLSRMGFTNILAVEIQGSALKRLEERKFPGVRVLALDMNAKGSWAQVSRYQPHAKAILLDPPREGLKKRRGLFKYLDNLEHIFYISCELETYARDAADLMKNKWVPTQLVPLDLFPHTPHVEICSAFTLDQTELSNR
jgi:23S rRNA (uracil1939-C5)-methyltransferase